MNPVHSSMLFITVYPPTRRPSAWAVARQWSPRHLPVDWRALQCGNILSPSHFSTCKRAVVLRLQRAGLLRRAWHCTPFSGHERNRRVGNLEVESIYGCSIISRPHHAGARLPRQAPPSTSGTGRQEAMASIPGKACSVRWLLALQRSVST